jgi:hypothetical protein
MIFLRLCTFRGFGVAGVRNSGGGEPDDRHGDALRTDEVVAVSDCNCGEAGTEGSVGRLALICPASGRQVVSSSSMHSDWLRSGYCFWNRTNIRSKLLDIAGFTNALSTLDSSII